ncbi:MAG: hypothetical protein HYS13_13655 [Planctomycetia bacterium]|nr:hypothetical protein [Planctomycetia bacterium]
MPTTLRWIVSQSASALHAAEAIGRGEVLADARMQESIAGPAATLYEQIVALSPLPRRLWQHLLALSAGVDDNRQLAEAALVKVVGAARAKSSAPCLATTIGTLENACRAAFPNLLDNVTRDGQALMERWDQDGAGAKLLKTACGLVDPRLCVESADVVLVHPSLGGGGAAHLAYNSVRVEVLAQEKPELPEIVHLAWLLSQLNIDLPAFSEALGYERIGLVAGLAMVPPVLQAAQQLGLAMFDAANIERALAAWRLGVEPKSTAQALMAWWNTLQQTGANWQISLLALEALFPDPNAGPPPFIEWQSTPVVDVPSFMK